MASALHYWSGAGQVVLAAGDVEVPRIKDDTAYKWALEAMNNAFRIFYNARKLISCVSDTKAKMAMTADLDDVGETGWGAGVNDLEEAFQHVATNGGKWKDTNVSTVGWACQDKIGGFHKNALIAYVRIPISLENFLEALNAKAATLNTELTTLRQHSSTVVDKVMTGIGDQALPTVGTPEWAALGDGLKLVDRAQTVIKPLLWLAAVNDDPAIEFTDKWLGRTLGAIGKVRGAVVNFDSATQAGLGAGQSVAFSAIAEGLSYIPVLGAYYQEAFQLIPGVMVGMTNIVQRRDALAAKLGVDLRQTLDYGW